MNDDQLLKLLDAIRLLALVPSPYPEPRTRSPALAFALTEIEGIASKAISERKGT